MYSDEFASAVKRQLCDALNRTALAVLIFDRELKLVFSTKAYRELLEVPESSCRTGTPLLHLLRAEYVKESTDTHITERIRLVRRLQTHYLERTLPNGTVLEIEGQKLPAGGFVFFYRDVTRQHKLDRRITPTKTDPKQDAPCGVKKTRPDQTLQKQATLMKITLESVDQGISLIDENLRLQVMNSRAMSLLGLPEHLTQPGTALEDLFRYNAQRGEYGDGDPEVMVRERVEKARRMEPHRFMRRRPNGTTVEISGHPVRGIGFVTTYTDVTKRETAYTELRLASKVFDMQDGIMITDSASRILRVNDAFTRITGYEAVDVEGNTPRILQSGRQSSEFYRSLWQSLDSSGYWEGEIWNRRKNGETFLEWLRISALYDEKGSVTYYIGAFSDISEQQKQRLVIERTAMEERVLGALARLSLEQMPMKEYLQHSLTILLQQIPWLAAEPRGGVFLVSEDGDRPVLKLEASHQIEAPLHTLCAKVEFGQCLCGRVASTRQFMHVTDVDDRHEIQFEGMIPHGHYIVPIQSGNQILGVLMLYQPPGHVSEDPERRLLQRAADVLSLGILRVYAEQKVQYLAFNDPLTELPNRRLLIDRIAQANSCARRGTYFGALLFIDLNRFKTLNDARGHAVGDDLLKQVAKRLVENLREEDTVARLGGDEFVVLLPKLEGNRKVVSNEIAIVADKIRIALAETFYLQDHSYHLTCSIGVSLFPQDGVNADALLRQADTAMYSAKREERDTVRFFRHTMQTDVEQRLNLSGELRNALKEEEFRVHYQPVVDSRARIRGAEALVRWEHPSRGLLTPNLFIGIAEETGHILGIGDTVLRTVCKHINRFDEARCGNRLYQIAVNISAHQFRQPEFLEKLSLFLDESGVPGSRLTLEITESVMMENIKEVVRTMHGIKSLGIRLALNDFGTGYSSLAYLRELPIDILKIDKSFVRDLPGDTDDAAIVETICSMARHLSLEVVAEGVETNSQLDYLRQCDCERYQGYFFHRPMTAEGLVQLLNSSGGMIR